MKKRFPLHAQWHVRAQDAREKLNAGLHRTLSPPMGLLFESDHLRRELGRSAELGQVNKLPALKLTAVGQIKVFGKCVVLPTAAVVDGGSAPDAGSTVEMHEAARAVAGGVLNDKMSVKKNSLRPRQERCGSVEMIPADLDHPDLGFGEVLNDIVENVGWRDKVGVEDGDELAAGSFQSLRKRAGLIAFAIIAVNVFDGKTLGSPFVAGFAGDLSGVIGAVIKHLDLELVQRIINLAGGTDNALGDHILVVHRKLDGHARQFIQVA